MKYSIRPAKTKDAASAHALEVKLIADGRGMVMGTSDIVDVDCFAKQWRRDLKPGGRFDGFAGARFVARQAKQVIGEASVVRYGPERLRHVATLAVGVHPEHWRHGIGRALTEACVDWCAAALLPVKRLELFVRSDNPGAIALYASLGFALEGTRKGFVDLGAEGLVDDLIMVRWLNADDS